MEISKETLEMFQQNGMTLRDFYAGQAMAGMLMHDHHARFNPSLAFALADRMLAAR